MGRHSIQKSSTKKTVRRPNGSSSGAEWENGGESERVACGVWKSQCACNNAFRLIIINLRTVHAACFQVKNANRYACVYLCVAYNRESLMTCPGGGARLLFVNELRSPRKRVWRVRIIIHNTRAFVGCAEIGHRRRHTPTLKA